MQLCKAQGVRTIKIDNIEFSIELEKNTSISNSLEVFPEELIKVPAYTPVNENDNITVDTIETDELSAEQLMFYSARPEEVQQ